MASWKVLARMVTGLATVATTGAYADLSGAPSLSFASQAEAEAGSDGTKYMNPLRTAEAIAALGSSFPAGTMMLFQQTSAPTGWTKQTTHNDKALRVVSGTASSGGSVDFSTVFGKTATDATTLTNSTIPSHTHNVPGPGVLGISSWETTGGSGGIASQSTGSGGSHTHGMDIRVKYVDLIIASKD